MSIESAPAMRLYLAVTLLLTALGLGAVALFNYFVDPTGHWHAVVYSAESWSPRQVLTVPVQRDERAFRQREIERLPFQPDLVLLGSSRVMLVDTTMFVGMQVFNAGMSSANIPDFVHVWLTLVAAGKVPRHVLVFLDASMLNANSIAGADWRSGEVQYRSFLAARHLTEPKSARARGTEGLAKLEDLLNGELTWRSIEAALPGSPNAHLVWTLQSSEDFPSSDRYAYRFDGSLLYKRDEMLPTADGVRVEIPPVTHYVYQEYLNWSLNTDAVELLFALLIDMKAHNVEVSALLTPVSDPFHSKLQDTVGYQRGLSDLDSVLERAQRTGVLSRACSAESVANAGCQRSEMLDFVHMLKPCIRRVLHYCSAAGKLTLPLAPITESFY
jgi:hypothetical protein